MNTQKGFAHAFLIIGLVVALVGALGFVFWQNFIYKEPVAKQDSPAVTKKYTSDNEKPVYTFENAIDDIQKVVSKDGCGGAGTNETINFEQVPNEGEFTGKNVVNKSLTHAYLTIGCGSQGSVALLKKENDSWVLLNEDARVYPMCNVVRGQSFPDSVVDKCYESDDSTDPVAI